MPATKTQLIGGSFQDSEGNVLANGYLLMHLSQDENISGVGNICSGIEIKIILDSDGNVASSTSTPTAPDQLVWANDIMEPVNAYYRVTGYTAKGQPAFGTNNQQVISGGTGGGTFNTDTWIPNSVFSWTPPSQSLVLQTNEVDNGSQSLLDLHAGTGVTLTDNGSGRVTISSSGPAGPSSGTSVFPVIDNIWANAGTPFDAWPWTVATRIPGSALVSFPTTWKISIEILANSGNTTGQIQNCCVKRTLRDSANVIDTTPILWGGTASPILGVGVFLSDTTTLALDPNHDYYFMWFSPFTGGNDVQYLPMISSLMEGGRYGSSGSVDHTGDTTLNAGIDGDAFGGTIKTWQAA